MRTPPAIEPAPVTVPKFEALAKAPTPPYFPPAPRYITLPGYHHNGGAVSTASVIDLDCYPLTLRSGRWMAGTASTT